MEYLSSLFSGTTAGEDGPDEGSLGKDDVRGTDFADRNFSIDIQRCFVLMPFDVKFRPIFDDHLSPAIGRAGFDARRADDVFQPGQVLEQIWSEINMAWIIVADLTDKTANVFYELGIAHTLGEPVVILTQREEDVAFDLRHLRYIRYDFNPRGCKKLESDLELALRAVAKTAKG